jgi:hypothetical protein
MFSLIDRLLSGNPELALLIAVLIFLAALIQWLNDRATRKFLRDLVKEFVEAIKSR